MMQRRLRSLISGAVVLLTAGAAAACSSSSAGSAASGGLSGTVNVTSIASVTGATGGFAGIQANEGMNLAVSQINAEHFLGSGVTLKVTSEDSQSSPQMAASLAASAVQDSSVAAILGPLISNEAIAVSPIVQKSGLPTVYTEAASAGVLTGDYTFRATPPESTYWDRLAGSYMANKGIKTLGVMYTSNVVTLSELATQDVPELASEYGVKVTSSTGVPSTTLDFSSPVQKVLASKPDAVAILLTGPPTSTVVTALRQGGFTGQIIATYAAGVGNLKPAGTAGAGVVWPSDFTAQMPGTQAQAFVKAFVAKYHAEPSNYAAERFDATWFLARGIKAADSTNRAAVQKGLASVAKVGFTGAEGKISFAGNDARLTGLLVEWNGTSEIVAPAPG